MADPCITGFQEGEEEETGLGPERKQVAVFMTAAELTKTTSSRAPIPAAPTAVTTVVPQARNGMRLRPSVPSGQGAFSTLF